MPKKQAPPFHVRIEPEIKQSFYDAAKHDGINSIGAWLRKQGTRRVEEIKAEQLKH